MPPEAEGAPKPQEKDPNAKAEGVYRVELVFDANTDQITMKSDAPTVLLLGILSHGTMLVTQNQITAHLIAMKAKAQIIRANAGGIPPGAHRR